MYIRFFNQKCVSMFYHQILFNVHCYLIVLLTLVAVIGDYVVQHSKLHIYQALFDNITHAVIGGLSWLIVCIIFKNRHSSQTLVEIAFCTLIASFIDLDHFLAAGSFYLKDATNLQNRPPFHCSTFPFMISFVCVLVAHFLQQKWMLRLSLIFLTAFASHHTRDATRRGFWFYPFGSTAPIPYIFYIGLTVAIPYIICLIMYFTNIQRRSDSPTVI